MLLRTLMPWTAVDGGFKAEGLDAVPYFLLLVPLVWSWIGLGVKRCHDRDKPGAWLLIQLIPLLGIVWFWVEAGCLAGTPGPNRFGPNSLADLLPCALAA